jgi:hypothetical protein
VTLFLETELSESFTHVLAEPAVVIPAITPRQILTTDDYLRLLDMTADALTG